MRYMPLITAIDPKARHAKMTKEEAIEWAARCLGAHYPEWACVEVREVVEFDKRPVIAPSR